MHCFSMPGFMMADYISDKASLQSKINLANISVNAS